MIGFAEAMRGRLFGARKEPASVTIAALEQEFAGVTPVELAPYDYRPVEGQIEKPTFRMSKQVIEVMHVPGVSKAKGEALRAYFVFTPATGAKKALAMANAQTEEALEGGNTFRFTFPPEAVAQVFAETGKGLVYVKGTGDQRWIFGVDVSCFVTATLRDLSPAA